MAAVDGSGGYEPLPSCITFNSASRKFTVTATNDACNGLYSLRVDGQVGTHTAITRTIYTQVRVQLLCVVNPSSLTTQVYVVGKTNTFTFPVFTKTNCSTTTTYSPTYTATISGAALPSYITLTAASRTFTVNPTLNSQKGTYVITVVGTVSSNYGKTYTASLEITLVIQPKNTEAPQLSTTLKDQSIQAGSTKAYSLPSITDTDGDGYSVSASLGAASFVRFSSPTFTIAPGVAIAAGTYQIQVTITDDNPAPMS